MMNLVNILFMATLLHSFTFASDERLASTDLIQTHLIQEFEDRERTFLDSFENDARGQITQLEINNRQSLTERDTSQQRYNALKMQNASLNDKLSEINRTLGINQEGDREEETAQQKITALIEAKTERDSLKDEQEKLKEFHENFTNCLKVCQEKESISSEFTKNVTLNNHELEKKLNHYLDFVKMNPEQIEFLTKCSVLLSAAIVAMWYVMPENKEPLFFFPIATGFLVRTEALFSFSIPAHILCTGIFLTISLVTQYVPVSFIPPIVHPLAGAYSLISLYDIFKWKFPSLSMKGNPLKKTLFSNKDTVIKMLYKLCEEKSWQDLSQGEINKKLTAYLQVLEYTEEGEF